MDQTDILMVYQNAVAFGIYLGIIVGTLASTKLFR